MNAQPTEITREDIESKFRELQGDIDETTREAKSVGLAVGAVVVVVVIGVVYFMGRRRGRKRSTIVEIRRI